MDREQRAMVFKGCSLKAGLMWMQQKREGDAKQFLREDGAALCRAEALIICLVRT